MAVLPIGAAGVSLPTLPTTSTTGATNTGGRDEQISDVRAFDHAVRIEKPCNKGKTAIK